MPRGWHVQGADLCRVVIDAAAIWAVSATGGGVYPAGGWFGFGSWLGGLAPIR